MSVTATFIISLIACYVHINRIVIITIKYDFDQSFFIYNNTMMKNELPIGSKIPFGLK